MLGGVIEFNVSAIDLKTLILGNGSHCWSPDFTDGHIPEGIICSKSLSQVSDGIRDRDQVPCTFSKEGLQWKRRGWWTEEILILSQRERWGGGPEKEAFDSGPHSLGKKLKNRTQVF